MRVAFVTGITGQDGSYLVELLLKKNYRVYGIQRRTSLFNTSRIDRLRNRITMRYGDLTDGAGLSNYINEIVRDNQDMERFEIYNLAAQSHVAISFEIPEYTSDVDGMGVMRLLEIIRTLPEDIKNITRFYQAGTSELYGKVLEVPQSETTPFNPVSPYAAAKLYAYHMVKIYREGYGLYAVNGILFNHESPRRGENFVTMKIVNGVKDIVSGKKKMIQLGNLNSLRDWGHARDYVRGMWMMLQQDNPDDFVLATGERYSVKEFVDKCFKFKNITLTWSGSGLKEVGKDKDGVVRVKVNKKYFRPCEVDILLGNPEKAITKLGWHRQYDTLNKLIRDMFGD
uniref:GDP-mannose 4,6-dehydratase n=1 Tax=viral metagenome TaxID=1070528 RepID=A0A6C0BYY5_9ZZZZ